MLSNPLLTDTSAKAKGMLTNLQKKKHDFLTENHGVKEFRTWCVIIICACSMVIEITCGVLFGSLALVADGIHMSSPVIAFFVSATAYSYSRMHVDNPKYVFGTAKIGDLAAYTSALILIGIAIYIIYDGIDRFINPQPLVFLEALYVAFVGLAVNIVSGILLGFNISSSGEGDEAIIVNNAHGHSHGHEKFDGYESDEDDHHAGHDETFYVSTPQGTVVLSIFEEGVPPVFRVQFQSWKGLTPTAESIRVETVRSPGKVSQVFAFKNISGGLESVHDIPEPHEFQANLTVDGVTYSVEFIEGDHHDHGHHGDHDDHGHDHGHTEKVADHGHDHGHSDKVKDHGHDHGHAEKVDDHGHDHGHADHPICSGSDDHDHGHDHAHDREHDHGHDHGHDREHNHDEHDHGHEHNAHEGQVAINVYGIVLSSETPKSAKSQKKKYEKDNNFRAAVFHVVADAFVSVLVIIAIIIAGTVPNTGFLDPMVAIIGATVIISWAIQLMRDSGENLLDLCPDDDLLAKVREVLQRDGSAVTDLHVWRLGPGHLGAVVTVCPPATALAKNKSLKYYQRKLKGFKALAHVTIEIYDETVE